MQPKQRYFDLAKRISKKGEHHQHQLGCIIVKRNKILGLGFNKMKTNPNSLHNYKFVHAEFDAILDSDKEDLLNSIAYIYRERKDGLTANARPCKSCMKTLENHGIKEVYYTTEEHPFYKRELIGRQNAS